MRKSLFIAHCAISCAMIIICAFICIPIGSVPFTLQTCAIMLIATLFGLKKSIVALTLYILLGIIGLPVFHAGTSGIGVLLGPTGGYIIGFYGITVSICFFFQKNRIDTFIFSSLAGHMICYVIVMVWFIIISGGRFENLPTSFVSCVLPFIIPDILKICLCSVIVKKLRPNFYAES